MIEKIELFERENQKLEKKVTAIQSGGIVLVSEEKIREVVKEHTYYIKNWQKYRRGCLDMVDVFSEFMD